MHIVPLIVPQNIHRCMKNINLCYGNIYCSHNRIHDNDNIHISIRNKFYNNSSMIMHKKYNNYWKV